MGWIFLGIFSLSVFPFILFWVLFFHIVPDEGETLEEAHRRLFRNMFRSGGFWLWAVFTVAFAAFVIAAYS